MLSPRQAIAAVTFAAASALGAGCGEAPFDQGQSEVTTTTREGICQVDPHSPSCEAAQEIAEKGRDVAVFAILTGIGVVALGGAAIALSSRRNDY